MKNLNWFQARNLAREENRAIRREAWRKWLVFGLALRFISKAVNGTEQRYVVPNIEFGRDEFLANDWTDEPWVDGTIPSGVTPPSVPYRPVAGGGAGGGGSGGSGNFGPPPTGGGGGGGGGGGDGEPNERHCPTGYSLSADGRRCVRDQNGDQNPSITVTIHPPDSSGFSNFDEGQECFLRDTEVGGGGDQHSADLGVSVSISGGPPGVGTLRVELQGQLELGTGWPGMNQDFQFSSVQFTPGGQVTATVQYTINGTTHDGSGNHTFPDWCSGSSVGGELL